MCVCVRVCVRVCVCACVCACVRACVRACDTPWITELLAKVFTDMGNELRWMSNYANFFVKYRVVKTTF